VRAILRALRSDPSLTGLGILVIALSFALSATVLSVFDACFNMLGRFESRTVDLEIASRTPGVPDTASFSADELTRLREQLKALEGVGAFGRLILPVSGGNESAHPETCAFVDSEYIEITQMKANTGRLFDRVDDVGDAAARVALISESFSRRVFGVFDQGVLGRWIKVNAVPFVVVGVVPGNGAGAPLGVEPGVWLPLSLISQVRFGVGQPALSTNLQGLLASDSWLLLKAKLGDGISLDRLNAELSTVELPRRSARQFVRGVRSAPIPLAVRGAVLRATVGALLGLIVFLAIACADAIVLMVERTVRRTHEFAVRLALGATPTTISGEAAYECLAIGGLAIALGIPVTIALLSFLKTSLPSYVDTASVRAVPSTTAFLLSTLITLGISFSGWPVASQQSRQQKMFSMLAASGTTTRSGRQSKRTMRTAVTVQIALATILAGWASLFVTHWLSLQRTDLGFNPRDLSIVTGRWRDPSWSQPRQLTAITSVVESLMATPGVSVASAASRAPLTPPDDVLAAPRTGAIFVDTVAVTPGYFKTLGIPLQGTDFSGADFGLILNEAAARLEKTSLGDYRPEHDSIVGSTVRERLVLGVVPDVRRDALRIAEEPTRYVPMGRSNVPAVVVVLVRLKPGVGPAAVQAVLEQNRDQIAWGELTSMASRVSTAMWEPRLVALGGLACASVGIVFMAIALYATCARAVTDRLSEIALRFAIGGSPGRVLWEVLREYVLVALLGATVGSIGIVSQRHFLEELNLPYQLGWFAAMRSAGVSITVAIIAAYLPARRATRTSPAAILKTT